MAELRIMIAVPLPDDMFERAQCIADFKPVLEGLRRELKTEVRIEHEISDAKTPKPRKQRADAGKARKETTGMLPPSRGAVTRIQGGPIGEARAERAASLIREAAQ